VDVGVVSLSGVVDAGASKLLTASQLALRVIPAINGLKTQLAALTKIGGPVSDLKTAVSELRAGQVELTRKVSDLNSKLAETRAIVKSLDNWVIATDFAQASGCGAVPVYTARGVAPASVVLGSASASSLAPQAFVSAPVMTTLTELLASDIDLLLE